MQRRGVLGSVSRALLSAVLAAGVLVVVNPADARSAAATGPTLLRGSLTVAGKPAAGAVVRVTLNPVTPSGGVKPGTPINVRDLPPVTTDSHGDFRVPLPDRAELTGFVDEWGLIDTSTTFSDASRLVGTRQSLTLTRSDSGRVGLVRRSTTTFVPQAARMDVDLSSGQVIKRVGEKRSFKVAPVRVAAQDRRAWQARDAQSRGQSSRHACRIRYGQKYNGVYERFGYVNNWVGAKATVTQGSGTTHELGVGVQPIGQTYKPFAGRTHEVKTRDSASQAGVVDQWMWNRVNYQNWIYRGLCPWPGEHFESVPDGIHSLLVPAPKKFAIPQVSYAGCNRQDPGFTYTKDTASNMTVDRGVNVGILSVSAKSGWNSDTSWTIQLTKPSRQCYSNDRGVIHSRYVHFFKFRRTEPCGRPAHRCRPDGSVHQ